MALISPVCRWWQGYSESFSGLPTAMASASSGARVYSHLWLQSLHLGSLPEPNPSGSEKVHITAPTRRAESLRTFFSQGAKALPQSSQVPFWLWPGGRGWGLQLLQASPRQDSSALGFLAGTGQAPCEVLMIGGHWTQGMGHRLTFQEQSDSPAWKASLPSEGTGGDPLGLSAAPRCKPSAVGIQVV